MIGMWLVSFDVSLWFDLLRPRWLMRLDTARFGTRNCFARRMDHDKIRVVADSVTCSYINRLRLVFQSPLSVGFYDVGAHSYTH